MGVLGEVLPYQQKAKYSCAAATLHAVLCHWEDCISEKTLMPLVGVKPGIGAYTMQIVDAAKKLGYDARKQRFRSVKELKSVTDQDVPVIANVVSFTRPPEGHFVVVTKVDGRVHLMDPNVGGNRRVLSKKAFDSRWKARGRSGVVVKPRMRTLRGGDVAEKASRVGVVLVVSAAAVVTTAVVWALSRHRWRAP